MSRAGQAFRPPVVRAVARRSDRKGVGPGWGAGSACRFALRRWPMRANPPAATSISASAFVRACGSPAVFAPVPAGGPVLSRLAVVPVHCFRPAPCGTAGLIGPHPGGVPAVGCRRCGVRLGGRSGGREGERAPARSRWALALGPPSLSAAKGLRVSCGAAYNVGGGGLEARVRRRCAAAYSN